MEFRKLNFSTELCVYMYVVSIWKNYLHKAILTRTYNIWFFWGKPTTCTRHPNHTYKFLWGNKIIPKLKESMLLFLISGIMVKPSLKRRFYKSMEIIYFRKRCYPEHVCMKSGISLPTNMWGINQCRGSNKIYAQTQTFGVIFLFF